jgi:hypothetical protein
VLQYIYLTHNQIYLGSPLLHQALEQIRCNRILDPYLQTFKSNWQVVAQVFVFILVFWFVVSFCFLPLLSYSAIAGNVGSSLQIGDLSPGVQAQIPSMEYK